MSSARYLIPGDTQSKISALLGAWEKASVSRRLWEKDPTIWKEKTSEQAEIANRLGWLELPFTMKEKVSELKRFADGVKGEFSHVIVLGMGGSSLAPEVFARTFGSRAGYPHLSILDTTHPAVIERTLDTYDLKKTLFLVASKSGGTAETTALFHTFFHAVADVTDNPGSHFVALTDSGSSMQKLAVQKKFRKIFNTPEDVGGRYSALTEFGLLPAALIGMDLERFLTRAAGIASLCGKDAPVANNPGFFLGAMLGIYAAEGRDKLTFFASPRIGTFPQWIEQLIAESTGKEGKGILPIVDEPFGGTPVYGSDRVFVHLRLKGDDNTQNDEAVKAMAFAGHPVIITDLDGEYDLSAEMYRWEVATAMAAAVLHINPFDQPNVQLAKTLATESLAAYKKDGKLPKEDPCINEGDVLVYGETTARTAKDALVRFLQQAGHGSYVSIMGFLPYSDTSTKALNELRAVIRDKYRLAVTTGIGPRFLHSTGQLHKGGNNTGLFIQLTTAVEDDITVPSQGYSFGALITTQAAGDLKALKSKQRKVLRFHFTGDLLEGIRKLYS